MIQFLRNFLWNSKAVLRSFNNPLKRIENLSQKDRLEREFYDKEANKHLQNFNKDLFGYDENEEFPQSHQYFYSLLENVSGKHILDCCCGYGFTSVKLAKRDAKVDGIDISPKMIELAQKNAEFNKVAQDVNLKVMSVQEMDFRDDTFDFAVGLGALHHLNLDLSGKEISRVLKPGGKAIFVEPRIPFKSLILVRSLFPLKCFESPGGSQLNDKDILQFSRYFSSLRIKYFLFLKNFARFAIVKKYARQIDQVDSYIITKIPAMNKFYWAFVLEFTK